MASDFFRQGDSLSCGLFNLVMDSVIQKTEIFGFDTIYNKYAKLLVYADNINVIRRTKRDVTAVFSALAFKNDACLKIKRRMPFAYRHLILAGK